MMRRAALAVMLLAACTSHEALTPNEPPAPKENLGLEYAEREVLPGLHLRVLKPGTSGGARLEPGSSIYAETVYAGDEPMDVALSIREVHWHSASAWERATLAGMNIGEVRRIWFCSEALKREFRSLSSKPCVVADYGLVEVKP
jgi:hypothetical protein